MDRSGIQSTPLGTEAPQSPGNAITSAAFWKATAKYTTPNHDESQPASFSSTRRFSAPVTTGIVTSSSTTTLGNTNGNPGTNRPNADGTCW